MTRRLERLTWIAPALPVLVAIVAALFSACSPPAEAAAPVRARPCSCGDVAIVGAP